MNEYVTLREKTEGLGSFWGFVIAQSLWMLLSWVVLQGFGVPSLEAYFVVVFSGLLFLRLVFVPDGESPAWWSGLNWIVRVGFVVMAYIVYNQFFKGV